MKLVVRGGSIPAGHGVKSSYVDILADYYGPSGIEVINRSRYRETSFDGIWSFHDDITPFHPDILAIHFGVDDAYRPVYRSEFKENLVQMVRLARNLFESRIILLTSHPFENQYDCEMMHIYYRTIREVSVDLDCELIPSHTYWMGYLHDRNEKLSDYLQEDDRYPNEKGHEIFAEAFINRIEKFIK